MVSLGVVLGLSTLISLGLAPRSVAQAAWPSASAYTVPVAQPQFRPWGRSAPTAPEPRAWRQKYAPAPRATTTAARRTFASAWSRRGHSGVTSSDRASARKAVPVTRGQDLGLRFRPDERASPYSQPTGSQYGGSPGTFPADVHSQFRPMRPKRKPTYEEIEARSQAAQPAPRPPMGYPMMPVPPLPGYGAYPPAW
jgi:hypothetical protein